MGLAAKPELGSPITELSLATAGLIFITGVFASAAMVIPGISGSFLMLLVGMYSTVSYAFRSFNIIMLGLFLLGALVGIVLVSLGISKVLKRYPAIAYWTILGLVQGSLVAIWPAIPFGDDILWSIIALGIGLTLSILLSSDKKDQAEESKGAGALQKADDEPKGTPQTLAVQKIQLSKGQLLGRILYQSTAAVIIFLATLAAWPKNPETYGAWPERDRPLVIAHQGGNLENPGNTMQAFEHAIKIGVDALEFDIHLTKDDIPVVIHDDTVDRTTNGIGAVKEMTLQEIKALDAAYHWPFNQSNEGSANYPYRGRGITIPTLEEVLAAFPEALMAIEMKTTDVKTQTALGDLLEKYARWDKTIVGSFSRTALRSFRDEYPQALTSASAEESLEYYAFSLLNLSNFWIPSMAFFQVPEESGEIYVLSESFRSQAQALGVRIQVWTPNTEEEFERIIGMGVNGIITDRPSKLLRILSLPD
jgi:glycerophosphoryl diester phosphodiesterase